jgi:hypothetical protein
MAKRVDECAALLNAGHASVGYDLRNPAISKSNRGRVERGFRQALERGGILRFLADKNGNLLAAIVAHPGSTTFMFKGSDEFWTFNLYSAPGPKALLKKTNAWFSAELPRIRPLMGKKVETYIDVWQWRVLAALDGVGIHAAGLATEGEIGPAILRLKRRDPKIEAELAASPYSIRPIRTLADVDDYLELIRQEFTRNPKFGWFVADPRFLKGLRKEFQGWLREGKTRAWVVEHRAKIVGGFEFIYSKWSRKLRCGSVGLNLTRSAQGKGLARFIYWTVLPEMARAGALKFEGSTGQPGVLKLARVMKRKCTAIEVFGLGFRPFPKGHFDGWIRELSRNS